MLNIKIRKWFRFIIFHRAPIIQGILPKGFLIDLSQIFISHDKRERNSTPRITYTSLHWKSFKKWLINAPKRGETYCTIMCIFKTKTTSCQEIFCCWCLENERFLVVVSAMGYFTLEVKGNGCIWFPEFVDSCSFVLATIICFRVLKENNLIKMITNSSNFHHRFKNYILLWYNQPISHKNNK